MKTWMCVAIVCAAGMCVAATDVQCVGVKGHGLMLLSNGRTGVCRLAGVMLPGTTPAEKSAFAARSFVKDTAIQDFLPSVTEALNAYVGQTLKIVDTAGKDVWLENADGQAVSCALVAKGLGIVSATAPTKHRKELVEAQQAAVKENTGVWALPPRGDAAATLKFKCSVRTDDNTAAKEKQNYSSFRTTDKLIVQKRVVELVIDGSGLKRTVVLNVRYQFRLVEYDGDYGKADGRQRSNTPVESMEVAVMPGETKTIECKSEEVTMMQHSDTDGARWSYKKGTSFEGEMLSVTCGGKEVYAKGKIEGDSSNDSSSDSGTKDDEKEEDDKNDRKSRSDKDARDERD